MLTSPAQTIDACAFRPARIPIRAPASRRRTTGGWRIPIRPAGIGRREARYGNPNPRTSRIREGVEAHGRTSAVELAAHRRHGYNALRPTAPTLQDTAHFKPGVILRPHARAALSEWLTIHREVASRHFGATGVSRQLDLSAQVPVGALSIPYPPVPAKSSPHRRRGVGDAYRTRGLLNSDVALKVLPGDLVRDPARRQHSKQDARAAGKLPPWREGATPDAARARAPYLVCDSSTFQSTASFPLPALGAWRFHAVYISTIFSSTRRLRGNCAAEAFSIPCQALSSNGSAC